MQLEIINSEPMGPTPSRQSRNRSDGNSHPLRPKAGAHPLDSSKRSEMLGYALVSADGDTPHSLKRMSDCVMRFRKYCGINPQGNGPFNA